MRFTTSQIDSLGGIDCILQECNLTELVVELKTEDNIFIPEVQFTLSVENWHKIYGVLGTDGRKTLRGIPRGRKASIIFHDDQEIRVKAYVERLFKSVSARDLGRTLGCLRQLRSQAERASYTYLRYHEVTIKDACVSSFRSETQQYLLFIHLSHFD